MFRRIKQLAYPLAILLVGGMLGGVFNARYVAPQVESGNGIVDVTKPEADDHNGPPSTNHLVETFGIPKAQAQYTIDVTRRGAIGNGTTDDAAAFQLAATALVDTGGVIWVPPDRKYKISSTIDIRSDKPIYVMSGMGNNGLTTGGYITPGAVLTNGIFRFRALNGETNPFEQGGGGVLGVRFMDPATRSIAIDSAIYVEDGTNFLVRDCFFITLAGRALRIENSTVCRHIDGRIYGCGDTNKPAIDVVGGPVDSAHNNGLVGYYGRGVICEATYNAPSLKVSATGGITIEGMYFEQDTGTAALQNSFIECAGIIFARNCKFNALGAADTQVDLTAASTQIGSSIIGCEFRGDGKALDVTSSYQQFICNGNIFRDCGADAVDAVTFDGGYLQFNDNTLYSSGQVWVIGPEAMVCNNRVYATVESTASGIFNLGGDTIARNNTGEGVATEVTIASGAITKLAWKTTHTVDTEADAASDDLTTIGGVVEGDRFVLRASNDARSVVIKDGTGNVECVGGADLTLDNVLDYAEVFYNGTKCIVTLHDGGA